MLRVETRGTWQEMGAQIGEEFRHWFEKALEHFAPWLRADLDPLRPAIEQVRELLLENCPELLEETGGMGEALGWETDLMLGFRFFNELRLLPGPGCSGLFLSTSAQGPLLARTCDLEPDLSQEIQLLRISRPAEGPATVLATYLMLTGGLGLNEHGLAITGSSASCQALSDRPGLPGGILNHLLMTRCRDMDEAARLLLRHTFRGKGAVYLVGDTSGQSMRVEMVSGAKPIVTCRARESTWQACSNFCFSKGLVSTSTAQYLENAYTRYGRIAHLAGEGVMERSVDGMKGLICDIAQPGPICPKEHIDLHTAYAFVVEIAHRKMHFCPGHPGTQEFEEITL